MKLDEDAPQADTEDAMDKDPRLPKRKVAVLIGYSGHGYKGMQLNPPHPTIEGDLFEAFVQAGAISRANSNDPKKSSLVRCARTDKGVHAAGNVISLKLIIEDPDIVAKINSFLPDQIRVWGIMRTLGSFNCYQMCDSRIYEYVIPTHVFLPPNPRSYLGKTMRAQAEESGDLDGYESRQEECAGFWVTVQEEIQKLLEDKGHTTVDLDAAAECEEVELNKPPPGAIPEKKSLDGTDAVPAGTETEEAQQQPPQQGLPQEILKQVKALTMEHKRAFRIPSIRLERLRNVLKNYVGTHNFHNYTVSKSPSDPSAMRHIKSFVASDPFLINGVEYLSLKVHGQSFMMHQIRKMIGMALLLVRCGTRISLIRDSYEKSNVLPIPKAPGIGLLLERPVFESYNKKCAGFGRELVAFDGFQKEMDSFRETFIYGRMWQQESREDVFGQFVGFVDGYRSEAFCYLGSKGVKAIEEARLRGGYGLGGGKEVRILEEDGEEEEVADDEEERDGGEGGGGGKRGKKGRRG